MLKFSFNRSTKRHLLFVNFQSLHNSGSSRGGVGILPSLAFLCFHLFIYIYLFIYFFK